MKLLENTVGSIVFTLTMNSYEGDVVEQIKEAYPFDFIFGTGTMLEAFENQLKGLEIGDEFKFMIPKEEAYGSYMEDMKIDMDKQLLIDQLGDQEMIDEELQVDNYIPMVDPDGNAFNGRIIHIGDEKVKMDFNHPLADVDLYFVGKVLNLRPATAQEIEDGKVMNTTQWEDAGPDDAPCV